MPRRKKKDWERFYDNLDLHEKDIFDHYMGNLIGNVKARSAKSQFSPLAAKEVIYKLLQRGFI